MEKLLCNKGHHHSDKVTGCRTGNNFSNCIPFRELISKLHKIL